jgi:triacylglycerol esterase/lipase EstA (alpha/beta hydrolase family)
MSAMSPFSVVFIGGFLAPSGMQDYFPSNSANLFPGMDIVTPAISGVASLHDRVCELFYQLVGGRVDFGLEHSNECGHKRWGALYAPLLPNWSSKNPVHLVSHSYGGATARLLQQYLHEKIFPGWDTSADWVYSITALNSPLNGSLMVYALGASLQDPRDGTFL